MKQTLALLGAFLILCFCAGCGRGTSANGSETAPTVEEETAEKVQMEEQAGENAEQPEETADSPDDSETVTEAETVPEE